jgi:predicted DNA-binding transcriptional regulator AlpA
MSAQLLDREEAAALLGIRWSTLKSWTYDRPAHRQDFPRPMLIHVGCGRPQVRWVKAELEEWSAKNGR